MCGYYVILHLVRDAHTLRGNKWPEAFMAKPTVVNILPLGVEMLSM
jgi:hypothetical protein